MPRKSAARNVRRPSRAAALGEVYAFTFPDGRTTVCQVIGGPHSDKCVELAALDWRGSGVPTIDDVRTARVARTSSMLALDEPGVWNVPRHVPWCATLVGVCPPVEQFPLRSRSWGGWRGPFFAGRHAGEVVDPARFAVDYTPTAVDLGAGVTEHRRDTWRLSLTDECRLPDSAPIRFSGLDVLPRLSFPSYRGRDAGVVEYVRARPLRELMWLEHGRTSIDLRASALEVLTVSVGKDPLRLLLPPNLSQLTLRGAPERVTIETPAPAFSLTVEHPRITAAPRGAERSAALTWNGIIDTDTDGLRSFRSLTSLVLRGAPGRITDAGGLAALAGSLRELTLFNLYALDAARWSPDWPQLDEAVLDGVAKAEVPALAQSLATTPEVTIRGAKTEAWIAENMSNPFREWEGDDPALGRVASTAWRKAAKAVRVAREQDAALDPEATLRALVVALNRRAEDIDTIRREEAGDAFLQLARELGVSEAQAMAWFDEWRDF